MSGSDEQLEIVRVDGSAPEWDRFVEAAEGSTFCHLGGWDSIMRDVLGHEPVYLAAVGADRVWRGVLPLVRVRSILGHYLVSLPFLNDGGPLGDDAAKATLVDFAVAEAKRSGAALLELRSRTELPGPVSPSNRKITVMLPLPDTVEALWEKTFKAKLRSQVRRPAKEGMTARSGLAELSAFYEVFARNMRDLGTPVLPRAFFERIAAAFGDRVIFTAVYSASCQTAAAGCSFVWKGEVEIVWASSLREFNKFSPNMMLLLDADGRIDQTRSWNVQLRPLHSGWGNAQVQAPVGRARRAAPMAVMVEERRAGGYSVAGPTRVPFCYGSVEPVAHGSGQSPGSDARATVTVAPSRPGEIAMKLRHQLAAYSPLSLAACAQSCAAAVGLAGGAHRQLHDLLLKDYDAESAVLCGSGTQALQLAISITATMVYDSGSSRPLIAMPGFSCFDLASAAIGADAHVSLYDVDPRTLGPDPRSFERGHRVGGKDRRRCAALWRSRRLGRARGDRGPLRRGVDRRCGSGFRRVVAWSETRHARRDFDAELRSRKGLDRWWWRSGAPAARCRGNTAVASASKKNQRTENSSGSRCAVDVGSPEHVRPSAIDPIVTSGRNRLSPTGRSCRDHRGGRGPRVREL